MKQLNSDMAASGGQRSDETTKYQNIVFVSYLETLSRKRRRGGWGSDVGS